MIRKILTKYNNASPPVRAAFWYTVCNVLNKGLALLSTPIFTRILTEEQYGDFAIFHSWYSILIIFTSLNIFMGGYTKGLLKFKDDIDGFTSSQLGLTTIITFFWGIIYLLDIPFWTDVFQIKPSLMVTMFAQLLVMPALEFWMAKERFSYHYKSVILVTLLCSFFCIAISVVAVLFSTEKLDARVYSDSIVKVIIAGILYVIIVFRGKVLYKKDWWKYALIFNLPLIPHYLANYALSQSDRLMIGRMVGSGEAAFYSVAYTISMMMLIIVNAINNALEPYIYCSLDSGDIDNISQKTNPLIILVAVMTVFVMAFAPEVIYVFAGSKYMDAIYVIPPIAAAVYFIFIYSLYCTVEYFYQKTSFIAIATTISALSNIVMNYFGIKLFGYHAAGYTTLICYILLTMLHYIFYRRILAKRKLNTTDIYNLKTVVGIGLILLLIMVIMVLAYAQVFIRYGIIVSLIAITFIKRNNLKNVINELGNKE